MLIGTYGGSFHALAATDGAVAWTFRAGGDIKAAAVVDPASGLCAVGSYDGHMCAPASPATRPSPPQHARTTALPCMSFRPRLVLLGYSKGTLRVLSRLVLLSEYLRCVAFRRASSCVSGGAGKQPWGHDAGTSKRSGCSVARRP